MSNSVNSYFGSMKTDLNDKWNNGDKQKKAKEDSLDLSLKLLMLFSEDMDSLRCTSILYDFLKNLDKNVKEIHLF